VISEDHFIAAEDREIGLLIRAMGIVPNAASRSNHESPSCLYKSITPKSSEDKGIELIKAATSIARNTSKDITTGPNKSSARDEEE
jgi:hypothetical protein